MIAFLLSQIQAAYPDLTDSQVQLVYDIANAYSATHSWQTPPSLDGIVNLVRSELRG